MMARKDEQSPVPHAPGVNGTGTKHSESNARELRRKKRIRYLLYFVAFVIFQSAVIAIFVLTIMKVRTPRFRLESGTFQSGTLSNQSFDGTISARIDVKNANFGKYKYEDTTIYFSYGDGGPVIGEVNIPKSSVGWRSTKKLKDVVINLNSTNVPSESQLGPDLSLGVVKIMSKAEMKGKVRLIFIFSKKKSTQMNCSMDIIIANKQLENISCD